MPEDEPTDAQRSTGLPAALPSGIEERVRSEDLLRGRTELIIEHNGRAYRLRVTQRGKLILTA
jgi:hemin uptake protein HemP